MTSAQFIIPLSLRAAVHRKGPKALHPTVAGRRLLITLKLIGNAEEATFFFLGVFGALETILLPNRSQ